MRKHQTGLTMITWIILIGMIGFIGIFAFKLIPIYMDYYTINNALTEVAKNVQQGEAPAKIKLSLSDMFDVNSVNTVKIDDISITPGADGKGVILGLDYDARTNFIANIDLMVHFAKNYPSPGAAAPAAAGGS